MRRSSLAVLAIGIVVGGCKPTTQSVYVDMASVLRAPAVNVPARPNIATPPKPLGAVTRTMPAKPATPIKDNLRGSGPHIRELIQQAQVQALKDIQIRLRKFYDSELKRFELEQQRTVSDAETKAYEDATNRIRAAFEVYATKRMPVFTQLTLFAGFPDPNPKSKLPNVEMTPVLQKRFDDTVELRKQLKVIDDEFDNAVGEILGDVQDLTAMNVADMRLKVEQFKQDLDKKAADEAASQVRATSADLGLTLIEPIKIVLPATPSHSVTIPAEHPMTSAPEVPVSGILTKAEDREKLLRQQLNIWAKLNRYEIDSKPGHSTDKTNEFLQWKQKFQAGN
ncbi:hypothetical protein BH11ARM1_BH11ARM1_01520 [soil metagenome]